MESYQKWIWQHDRWPSLTLDAEKIQPLLANARHSLGLLLGRAQAIGLENLQPQVMETMTWEAMTTSAIEGEKLNLNSIRSSIARRLGLDEHGAPQSEAQRDIEGLLDVLQDATTNLEAPLTIDRLCGWHAALFPTGFSGMQRIDVGKLRSSKMEIVSGHLGRQKIHYEAPPWNDLVDGMQRFVRWFNDSHPHTGCNPTDGLVRASIAHLWFETLHPFDDGNGRIGRAIMQLALGNDMGIPGRIISLSRQIESSKSQYYRELEHAQRSKSLDATQWVLWMLREIQLASDFSSRTIDTSIQRIQFQASLSSISLNERQQKTLKKLLDAGPRQYIGGMTTKKHQHICQVSTPTAARDLIEMEKLGILIRHGFGRATRYYPAIEGWAEQENEQRLEVVRERP